ncbi:MAG: DUF5688 family protein [Lachnospiraceae bacterium]|nr:DUF5688 family protein [Lachnospiraceae bacterium]
MRYEKFCNNVKDALDGFYGPGVAELKRVKKNNGVTRCSVVIKKNGSNVCPAIYLEELHESYENGEIFSNIISKIIETADIKDPVAYFDAGNFMDFDRAKDKIFFKLINREMNRELLKDVPYIAYMDMAVVFYYQVSSSDSGDASILITNTHAGNWKTDKDSLFEYAKKNTKEKLGIFLQDIMFIVNEVFSSEEDPKGTEIDIAGLSDSDACRIDSRGMYVLSNKRRFLGACAILYPEILEKCCRFMGGDFYILPSSIHEVIMISAENADTEALINMVREVNDTQVADEEILSYSVYRYDASDKRLSMLCEDRKQAANLKFTSL